MTEPHTASHLRSRRAEKGPRFLEILNEIADKDGVTPALSIEMFEEKTGSSENGIRSMFSRLQQIGCVNMIEKGRIGMVGRYKLTGNPYRGQTRKDGRRMPKEAMLPPPVPPVVDPAGTAKSLRDKHGIEVTTRDVIIRTGVTSSSGGGHIAISLPRVRFAEGSPG